MVYRDLLIAVGATLYSSIEVFVVNAETETWGGDRKEQDDSRWPEFQARFPSLRRDTYLDFWTQNKESVRLNVQHDGGGKRLVLVGADQFKALSAGREVAERNARFAAAYPRGKLLAFSAIGSSDDGRQALVYLHDYCGGSGSYYLLEKAAEGWRVAGEFVAWQE